MNKNNIKIKQNIFLKNLILNLFQHKIGKYSLITVDVKYINLRIIINKIIKVLIKQ